MELGRFAFCSAQELSSPFVKQFKTLAVRALRCCKGSGQSKKA
jgi:hypothetical protein